MNRRRFLACAAAAPFAAPAVATAQDVRAASGDSLVVGGVEYRLCDILAPDIGTPRGQWSARILSGLAASGEVSFVEAGPPDRWGRRPASGRVGEAALADAMIAAGAARVSPETDDLASIRRLLALEEEARGKRLGLWSDESFAVLPAARAGPGVGAFGIVAGTVAAVAVTRRRTYVNFGPDYRTDFTAGAASRLTKKWKKSGVDLAALNGRTVRIRGYLAWINGPSIDLLHPMQIETLA